MSESEGCIFAGWKFESPRIAPIVLKYHVAWVCEFRRWIIKIGVHEYLGEVLTGLLRQMLGVEIETIGFDGDHLHMVMIFPLKYSISEVMGD